MHQYSKDDALNLYRIARETGIESLTTQEQRAVRKIIQELNLPVLSKPEISEDILRNLTHEETEELTKGIEFVEKLPPIVTYNVYKRTYAKERQAMILFGKPIVVRDNITRKQANELVHHIKSGKSASFQPRGMFTAGRDADPLHVGMFRVIGQYVGGETSEN